MNLQLLTSKSSWLYLNKKSYLEKYFKKYSNQFEIITDFKKIKKNLNNICIILSFYKIIPSKFLKHSKFNLVVHESNLPKGKGFSPLYWQILKGSGKIVFTLFEATQQMDAGDYYLKKSFDFKKDLFYNDIKVRQLDCALKMISIFLKKLKRKDKIKIFKQKGTSTYFRKRNPIDSMLKLDKSLISQINLIRICDDKKFPAFFKFKNKRFVIREAND